MVNTDATFQAAADTVQALVQGGQLTDQATQLQLYGLYKQATCGDCDTAAPPFYQLKAKQKWAQWDSLRGVEASEARRRYVDVLRAAIPDWQGPTQPKSATFGPVFSSLADASPGNKEDALPPLHAAARVGDVAALQALLSKEDVDAQDEEGCTALHWAADGNHVAAVELLLRSGADSTVCDSQGDTPLAVALLCSHQDVVRVLQG